MTWCCGDVGRRSVGPPSPGGSKAKPTEDVVCYLNVAFRAGQAMARFPRRPAGPSRSASLRTNRLTRSRTVLRKFGWPVGPPQSASVRTNRLIRSRTVLRKFGWFIVIVTEGVTRDPERNLAIAWPISDLPRSYSASTCLDSTRFYRGDGGQTPRHPPSHSALPIAHSQREWAGGNGRALRT